jgi:hypothetical protein
VEEEPSDDDEEEEEEEEVPSSDGQNERIVVNGICNPEDASSMSDNSCHGNINEGTSFENGDNDDEYDGAGVKVLYNMRDGNVVPQLM